jgi:hypothetical protein
LENFREIFLKKNSAVFFHTGSWVYATHQVSLSRTHYGVDWSQFMANEEWNLGASETQQTGTASLEIQQEKYKCCPEIYESVHLKFTAKRRSGFYFRTFKLPAAVLAAVILLSFCIPFTIGERISFATTMALALVVFLLTLADQLPKTEETPELQRLFMGLMYGAIALTALVAVMTRYE